LLIDGLVRIERQVKVSSPEESCRIVVHEKVEFTMKRTKQDAQSLRMKMQNAEVVFESLERSYRYYALQPLVTRLSN